MIMTRRQAQNCFSPHEIVRLRRSLITDGNRAECPRCHHNLSVLISIDDRCIGGCQVACEECGGTLEVPDQAREVLLTRP